MQMYLSPHKPTDIFIKEQPTTHNTTNIATVKKLMSSHKKGQANNSPISFVP